LNQPISLLLCFAVALLSNSVLKAAPQPGEELFRSRCAGCHGLDGRGGEHGPDIATTANIQRLSDAAIANIIRKGKPGAGMPAFGSAFEDRQINDIVAHLRFRQGIQKTAIVSGDPRKGRTLFFGKGQCSECHMIDGQGGFIASDLSAYGQRHSADQIREAIVNPGQTGEAHATVVVTARDGGIYRGLVRNEDNFSLQLQTLDGVFHFFDKSTLTSIEREPHSLMPRTYGTILSSAELDNVVSFLFRGQASKH